MRKNYIFGSSFPFFEKQHLHQTIQKTRILFVVEHCGNSFSQKNEKTTKTPFSFLQKYDNASNNR